MTDVVNLENFDTPLTGTHTVFYVEGGPFAHPVLPRTLDSILHGEPYNRRVLITSPSSRCSSLFRCNWDAVFQPADQKEWTLILTYCSYAPRPLLVHIDDTAHPPDAFFQRLPQGTTITEVRRLETVPDAPAGPIRADAIFYPPVQDLTTADAAAIIRSLNVQVGSRDAEGKKAYLRELRVARAGLAWTRIHETTSHGATYWYDPADGPTHVVKPGHSAIAHHLRVLADQVSHKY
jgi:hypothetical protein